jgi:hypothetical protein
MRKLSLIKVLTLRVRVSLNGHVYIGLYLTDFSVHARSKLHGQKRQVEKFTHKKKKMF